MGWSEDKREYSRLKAQAYYRFNKGEYSLKQYLSIIKNLQIKFNVNQKPDELEPFK